MKGYIVRRILYGALVVFLAVSAVFVLLRFTGDPVLLYAPMDTAPKDLEQIRERMGLNDPIYVQYARYIGDALQGDFGESTRLRRPATEVVIERIPATLELGAASLAIAMVIGIPLGILASVRHGSIWDRIAGLLATLGQAVPNFWLGLILILFFSVNLGWLPTSGRGGLMHLLMPAVTLAAVPTARFARLTRSTMLDVLGQDYIRTAQSKGLPEISVITRHAFKNASISLITLTAFEIGGLLGGSVVVEQIFAWPGMGRMTIQALLNRDFTVVTAAVVLFSVMYTLANLLADVAYAWVNPQVRLS